MAGSPASRPPRIARASGAFASLPRSSAKAPGIMAKKAARAVIVTGLTRIDADLRIACVGVRPSLMPEFLGEVGHQHRVGDLDPDDEDEPQQRLHVDRRAR